MLPSVSPDALTGMKPFVLAPGQGTAIDKRANFRDGETGRRAQRVANGQTIGCERVAFGRGGYDDHRRQVLCDIFRRFRVYKPVGLGDGFILVEIVEHALYDIGAVELIAKARGGKKSAA